MSRLSQVARAFLHNLAADPTSILSEEGELPLVIGVSGGPDSLALLHVLIFADIVDPGQLIVGHLNHKLRVGSDAEMTYVEKIANEWGVRICTASKDVSVYAQAKGESIEAAARVLRYRFLANVAVEHGAPAVLVGHTADDQVETVLMHFVRGAGLAGLQGMQAVTNVPHEPTIGLLRPLLTVWRDEVEAYCVEHGLKPIRDPSNQDPDITRNRIRHELLPYLATYNRRIRQRVADMASIAGPELEILAKAEADAWDQVLTEHHSDWLRLDRHRWRSLPIALQRRLLRRAHAAVGGTDEEFSFAGVEAARRVANLGNTGAAASLPGGRRLVIEGEFLRVESSDAVVPVAGPQLASGSQWHALQCPARLRLANNWILTAEVVGPPRPEQIRTADPWIARADALAAGELIVRGRTKGERFQPLGMGGRHARISDVMIDLKIPARARDRWPIIANRSHAIWLTGHRLDRRVRITEETLSVVELRCFPEVD